MKSEQLLWKAMFLFVRTSLSDLNRHGRCHPPDFEARPFFLLGLWALSLRDSKALWCYGRYHGHSGAVNRYGYRYG